jgi:hypothetical protein
MKKAGYNFSGMVDILAQSFEHHGACGELNVIDNVFNARVTGHIPMREVADALSAEKILETIKLSHEGLRRFGIDVPKIAVAALNPHGGENGECGTEEIDIIGPAIEIAPFGRYGRIWTLRGRYAVHAPFQKAIRRRCDNVPRPRANSCQTQGFRQRRDVLRRPAFPRDHLRPRPGLWARGQGDGLTIRLYSCVSIRRESRTVCKSVGLVGIWSNET